LEFESKKIYLGRYPHQHQGRHGRDKYLTCCVDGIWNIYTLGFEHRRWHMDVSTCSSDCRHFIDCQLCHCRAAGVTPGKESLLLFLSCDIHSTCLLNDTIDYNFRRLTARIYLVLPQTESRQPPNPTAAQRRVPLVLFDTYSRG
jgi:hypothetical protein